MEGVNPRILGGISQELAEQTARSGIQTLSNKGLNTISRQITEEGVEDTIRITTREGVETIGEHVVQEGLEDTIRITTREGIEDTIQTATRDRIEAFGQRITSEGISIGSHPWESIYSGVKENAAILEKQVIQQEIYILNRYDSTYGIRATEQKLTREGVETTLETASREGIEEMQEQAMREAAEAMERGRVSSKGGTSTLNDWINKIPELSKQAPIEIPSNATVKTQAKNGYDQITFKWTENGQTYEVRWHTKTPDAPEGQGNTWVVSRVTPGTPTGQVRTEHILVGDTWLPRYQWQDAINAYKNGTATQEQLQLLKNGHWQAP